MTMTMTLTWPNLSVSKTTIGEEFHLLSPQTHGVQADVSCMQFEMRRGIVAGCACLAVLLPACTGVTEITAPAEESDEPTELALVDEVELETLPTAVPTGDSTDGNTGESFETTPAGPDTVEPVDDWVEWDVQGVYQMDVPGYMDTRLWLDTELDLFIEEARETGLEVPRQLLTEYDQLLQTAQGIIFFAPDGDSLTAHRSFGTANELINHEYHVDQMKLMYSSFASNVELSSEPRKFGDIPGILVRGTYDIESSRRYHYGFSTHSGAYLYYFTVELVGQDDPEMVTELFRSIVINS